MIDTIKGSPKFAMANPKGQTPSLAVPPAERKNLKKPIRIREVGLPKGSPWRTLANPKHTPRGVGGRVVPGLTCVACGKPFNKALAALADDGWEHAGRCPVRPRDPRRYHIEDIEWMAETGESLDGAAARLGVRPASLERRLERMGRHDLAQRLRCRWDGAA